LYEFVHSLHSLCIFCKKKMAPSVFQSFCILTKSNFASMLLLVLWYFGYYGLTGFVSLWSVGLTNEFLLDLSQLIDTENSQIEDLFLLKVFKTHLCAFNDVPSKWSFQPFNKNQLLTETPIKYRDKWLISGLNKLPSCASSVIIN